MPKTRTQSTTYGGRVVHRLTAACLLALFLYPVGIGAEAPASIGVAITKGEFRLDNHTVSGNATIFDGNTLETFTDPSELRIQGGVRVLLDSGSRAKVFGGRLVLEQGHGEWDNNRGYAVEALGLRIVPTGGASAGRIAYSGERSVQIAALRGGLRVMNTGGSVVAVMAPGMALEFQPQAPAGAQLPFEMTGCVERRDGRFVLRDLIAGVLEEIRGDRLDREVGNVVEVVAFELPKEQPVAGAMEVVQVTRMRRVRRGCPAPPPSAAVPPAAKPAEPPEAARPKTAPPKAAPQVAKTPAPPVTQPTPPVSAPSGGMSGAKKAVIAGVIVGGAGAGAAVYLTQKEKETISR